jgi:hypothetical protein
MKERTIVATVVASLAFIGVLATGNTDVIFVVVTIALFAIGIAYAEGCEKL